MELSGDEALSFSDQSKADEESESEESQESESEEKVTYARSKKVMEMDAL